MENFPPSKEPSADPNASSEAPHSRVGEDEDDEINHTQGPALRSLLSRLVNEEDLTEIKIHQASTCVNHHLQDRI